MRKTLGAAVLMLAASAGGAAGRYAKFPNHYQGDSTGASAARGEASTSATATRIANAIRAVKRDETGPRLQKEFFEKTGKPVR